MTKTTLATRDDHTRAMRTWHVVDASQHVLGRMAVRIATVLMGKHRPDYTPHLSVGEGVIVVNAAKAVVTGNKREGKTYRRYTGHVGGLKEQTLEDFLARDPEKLIKTVVRRMLPKNRMGRDMLRHLKVYPGPDHPHQAQKPTPLSL
jgi:large subunit ribosomal protein L13